MSVDGIVNAINPNGMVTYVNVLGQLGVLPDAAAYKENITPISDVDALKLLDIPVNTFNYIGSPKIQSGITAEDLVPIFPDAVIYAGPNPFAVRYQYLVPHALKLAQIQATLSDQFALDISTLRTDVNTNSADISVLRTDVDTLRVDVDALQVLTTLHTSQISALNTLTATHTSQIAALTTQVNANTAAIAANTAAIAAIKTIFQTMPMATSGAVAYTTVRQMYIPANYTVAAVRGIVSNTLGSTGNVRLYVQASGVTIATGTIGSGDIAFTINNGASTGAIRLVDIQLIKNTGLGVVGIDTLYITN